MLWSAELWANHSLILSARESSCWDIGVSRLSAVSLLARSKGKTLESPVAFCGMRNMIPGSMPCLEVLNCSRLQLSMVYIKNNIKLTSQFENSTFNDCIIGFWESCCLITVEIASVLLVSLFDQFNVPRLEMNMTSLYCLQVHFENLFADWLTKYLYNSWTVFVP